MSQIIYEAEDADITGAVKKTFRAGANNAYVDYLNNTSDAIQWTIEQDVDGESELAFRYALGGSRSRSMRLIVDGEVVSEQLNFQSTGEWENWTTHITSLQLDAGTHTIRLEANGQSGPNIDYLQVTTGDGGNETQPGGGSNETLPGGGTVYQAENASLGGVKVSNQHDGSSGGYVDFINSTGDYVQWNVNAGQAGNYDLAFQYASTGNAREVQLVVNGVAQSVPLSFTTTGDWEQWKALTKTVALQAGNNTIRLQATGDSGPNVDYLRVTPAGSDTTPGGGGNETLPGGGGGDGNFSPFEVRVNFQDKSSPLPSGYVADRGEGYSATRGYGWVTEASLDTTNHTPINISIGGRDRNIPGYDQRVDTLIHMEDTAYTAAWEYAVKNGTYAVTVSVGDGNGHASNSINTINVEGVRAITNFVSTDDNPFAVKTVLVNVTDGKLTLDPEGGFHTKVNFAHIERVNLTDQPEVASASPTPGAVNVKLSEAMTFDVTLKTVGVGVNGASLNNSTVELYKTDGFIKVAGNHNTSGGGDTIIFKPNESLDPNTHYTMLINGAKDTSGKEFVPFSTSFTTGTDSDSAEAQFSISQAAKGDMVISLQISPDNSKLFGATVDGKVIRWDINPQTGALSNKQVFTGLQGDPDEPAVIIGLAFDPNDPNTLWVSHNASYFTHAEDFTGQVSKLHLQSGGAFNPTVEKYIVGLPRSNHDHMTNSLSFGPDGYLYLTQGSNTAMGALDTAWGDREERELTATMLRINPDVNTGGKPINVQTENYTLENGQVTQGNYNPYATNAPVQIYATGLRNAYDHVWHSNGKLYAPDNGSASGGVVPDDPSTPINENTRSVIGQHDVLYMVEKGGYYGHPNELRGEYILRGGNPTAGIDTDEVVAKNGFKGYSVGVKPEPNYHPNIFDFGDKQSADGIIELKSSAYGGAFQHALLVTRYSAANDIVAVHVNNAGQVVGSSVFADNLVNPLDLIEHIPSGRIYVAEFRGFDSKISMLTPTGGNNNLTFSSLLSSASDSFSPGTHEAETANFAGAMMQSQLTGFTGDGYLHFSNAENGYVEWTFSNLLEGMYNLDWRYMSNKDMTPLELIVNSQRTGKELALDATEGKWEETSVAVHLAEGTNTIRLHVSDEGDYSIDSFALSGIA